jgi:hypothetical protein
VWHRNLLGRGPEDARKQDPVQAVKNIVGRRGTRPAMVTELAIRQRRTNTRVAARAVRHYRTFSLVNTPKNGSVRAYS